MGSNKFDTSRINSGTGVNAFRLRKPDHIIVIIAETEYGQIIFAHGAETIAEANRLSGKKCDLLLAGIDDNAFVDVVPFGIRDHRLKRFLVVPPDPLIVIRDGGLWVASGNTYDRDAKVFARVKVTWMVAV